MTKNKTYFNWSSGKDSALALHYLLKDNSYHVACLLTSINKHFDRVSMHGLKRELLEKQVEAIGINGDLIELPAHPSNEEYEKIMKNKVNQLKEAGFLNTAFGDIYLEDLRAYREQQLAPFGITSVFPLWKRDTKTLIQEFIDLGFKAITVSINAKVLDKSFLGREIDQDFINELPDGVDPCGENGEYHTFCFDGPIFKYPVKFEKGAKVYREYEHGNAKNGFWFCDLIPQ